MDSKTAQSDLGTGMGRTVYSPAARDASGHYYIPDNPFFAGEAVKEVAGADPSNIQQVAASQLAIIGGYYKSVLRQAQQSFLAALIASIIGLSFFIAAVSFLLIKAPESVSIISLISGALVEIIAGLNFYLYGQTSRQFATFHMRLDRTQNFLLANSVCANLQEGETKETSRAELVRIIANASPAIEQQEKKNTSDQKTK